MKFSIGCSDLKKALQQVINVIPTKTTLPILSHVLFELKDNQITLSATDLEVSLKTIIKLSPDGAESEGSITISGRLLFDVVRELPDIPLDISVVDNNRILVKSSRGQYTFFGEDIKDFPQLPAIDVKHEISFNRKLLHEHIDKSLFAVSTDELRASLMGVLLQVKENEYRMVSTNGHRLVKIINKRFTGGEPVDDIIIPVKALNLLQKNLESDGDVKVSFASNHVIFDLDNVIINAMLIEGKYPDYDKVIPSNNDKKLLINREQLISALRTVSVLANKITQQVKISLEKSKVTIASQDMDRGEGLETIEAEYTGDPMEIGFNSVYLLDVLNHLDSENVEFLLDTSVSPALVFPENQKEDEDILMLVMPIKLRE